MSLTRNRPSRDSQRTQLDHLWSYRSYNSSHHYDDSIRLLHLLPAGQIDVGPPRWVLWVSSNYLHTGGWSSFAPLYLDFNNFFKDNVSDMYSTYFRTLFDIDRFSFLFRSPNLVTPRSYK